MGDAAEKHSRNAAATMCTHDDQIDPFAVDVIANQIGDIWPSMIWTARDVFVAQFGAQADQILLHLFVGEWLCPSCPASAS